MRQNKTQHIIQLFVMDPKPFVRANSIKMPLISRNLRFNIIEQGKPTTITKRI